MAIPLTPAQIDRFWSKVDKSGECWIWTGWLKHNGYGMFDLQLPDGRWIKRIAARVAYELCVGPLVEGLTIDHMKEVCSSRACVRPSHLRQITRGANVLAGNTLAAQNKAKTHCVNGHAFTEENIYIPPKRPGRRYCKQCQRDRDKRLVKKTTRGVMSYR